MLLPTLEQAARLRDVPRREEWCCSAPSWPSCRRPREVNSTPSGRSEAARRMADPDVRTAQAMADSKAPKVFREGVQDERLKMFFALQQLVFEELSIPHNQRQQAESAAIYLI